MGFNDPAPTSALVTKKQGSQTKKMQNMYILNRNYTLQTSHWPKPVAT
jgi:hypothetical protein